MTLCDIGGSRLLPCNRSKSTSCQVLLQRHSLFGQFLFCFLIFGQMRQPHAAQHIGCLGELNIVVTDYLYAVAPRVAKIKEGPVEWGNPSCLERLAGGLFVVDDEAKVATIISRLRAALLKRNELIAQVNESHRVTFTAQFKLEETAIECQGLVDIPHLQCDVVEAYHAWFLDRGHRTLLCYPADQVGNAGSRSNRLLRRSADLPQIMFLGRANIARSARVFETADRNRDDLLRQPQHHLRKIDRKRDRDQKHDIDRQR